MSTLFLTILALILCAGCTAWSPGTTPRHDRKLDRRSFISSIAIIGSTVINTSSAHAAHAAATQEQKDEENIVKGYNRLQYLLDNWDDEVCAHVYKLFL